MKFSRIMWASALFICCAACSKNSDDSNVIVDPPLVDKDTTPQAKYDITLLDNSMLFNTVPEVDTMQLQYYKELSGIAASKLNKGVLYVHDDDNGTHTVIVTNAKGDDLGKIMLDNISTYNLEDIAVGPGPVEGKSYIYLADIGDNAAGRSSVAVYRFEEPLLADQKPEAIVHITIADKIQLTYPKAAMNAETMMVEPLTKDIYIASKEKGKATLYVAAYPQSVSSVNKLLPVVKTNFDLLTSGDISPDGSEILLRNKGQIWYWKRSANQTIKDIILTAPTVAPYYGNEHQGEGICFGANNEGYYTDTETKDHEAAVSTISFYKRK